MPRIADTNKQSNHPSVEAAATRPETRREDAEQLSDHVDVAIKEIRRGNVNRHQLNELEDELRDAYDGVRKGDEKVAQLLQEVGKRLAKTLDEYVEKNVSDEKKSPSADANVLLAQGYKTFILKAVRAEDEEQKKVVH